MLWKARYQLTPQVKCCLGAFSEGFAGWLPGSRGGFQQRTTVSDMAPALCTSAQSMLARALSEEGAPSLTENLGRF